jgi:hypothetical protein
MIALLFAFLPFVLVFLLIVYAVLWGITHLKWIIMGFVLVFGAVATCSYSRADTTYSQRTPVHRIDVVRRAR